MRLVLMFWLLIFIVIILVYFARDLTLYKRLAAFWSAHSSSSVCLVTSAYSTPRVSWEVPTTWSQDERWALVVTLSQAKGTGTAHVVVCYHKWCTQITHVKGTCIPPQSHESAYRRRSRRRKIRELLHRSWLWSRRTRTWYICIWWRESSESEVWAMRSTSA